MKRIAKSAGFAAMGLLGMATANAQTSYGLAPSLTPQELSKTWSASVALRGFYDDNYNTGPKGQEHSSTGFEASPKISFNMPMEQTFIGLSAIYSMRYYGDRPSNSADHTIQVDGSLTHSFSERNKVSLSDSFVVAQEQELLNPTALTSFIRTEGNNVRNRGAVDVTTGLTPTISAVWGYANTFYDYEQTGTGSRSALLDRMEHLFSVNGRWQVTPATVGVLGYQYGLVDYTSNDPLTTSGFSTAASRKPSFRDSRSQYGFVGADHNFTAQLLGSIRGGIQYTEYPNTGGGSGVSPYADGSASWTYGPGSFVQGGVRYSRNATDVAFNALDATPTLDAESLVFYTAINHQFTANLTASILGQVQYSTFNGGSADSISDTFFTVGLNFAYRVNQFLSAEAGYNFDHLDSGLDAVQLRSFDRNRIYVGLRATY